MANTKWYAALDLLLALVAGFHVFMAPYTKVEESFNTQAMHDILYHAQDIGKYDHLDFPGVVPRTFIGAFLISALASPFVALANVFGFPKLASLYVVRLTLGSVTLGAMLLLRREIRRKFGSQVSTAFALITAMQFHLLYYSSRPLPNIFAFACVTLGYYFWFRNSPRATLRLLVFAMVVFRCDVILLLVPIGLSLLITRAISFWDAAKCCSVAAIVSIVLTVGVDSIMWRRWVWPELEVFWFNSYHNRSSEWGVSPFYWYFTSALPRTMVIAYPLVLVGLAVDRRILQYALPALGFVILYSKLPHKEVRFILLALPLLNVAAAAAIARLYNNRKKNLWSLAYYGFVILFFASASYAVLSGAASYANYPGGQAIGELHSRDNLSNEVHKSVHIDVLPAMTGVSRFCEQGKPWSYSKQEGLSDEDLKAAGFTYLLHGTRSVPDFQCLMEVNGFSRIKLQPRFPPLLLENEPKVYILGSEDQQWSGWPGCK